ncbi:UDP pyrophosphate phosphatase [Salimicrobium jeotgali]|uniref:Undecaprenyl-diphosphatase n=2 Tax=Salimicrobium TaxID=351195 RepID=K2GMP5_9BACI|nr:MULTISPECIES: undecaprenyl-diphosphate phosphatase [Salimicrobium]AKG04973.1 UDP pyrophosphate phosphatase [Salimicrobium jeotgali]EKE31654.1 undecaprenyl pyrophosphate phosphatase [Salimicrobium jeotgali]MBM7696476.1 undecaprenyl-diphosphatase [Salimicrobium jeotgali]SIS45038.1 Undecaprenyl-diphosphatase [Salimicrobium salexigens]
MEAIWLWIKYLLLGIFQGFTEPIPISSSGHLVILQELISLSDEGLDFLVLVNFGSLIAVLIIYRNDITRLIRNGFGYIFKQEKAHKEDFDFILYLVVATIPAGILGVVFGDYIDSNLDAVWIVGATLLVTGLALWVIRNIRGGKNDRNLTMKDAVIVGLAQGVALIPGISRSGATIVAAMLLGMKQETALRFSFLLFIPVSLGSMLLSLEDILGAKSGQLWAAYVLAFAGSIVASYYSLRWFMNVMANGNLKYFAYYCFAVGILVLLFLS